MKWTISSEDAGKRLDLFLVEQEAGLSRSAIQKQIKAGDITVNGKKAMVHRFLKENDCVEQKKKATASNSSDLRRTRSSPLTLRGELKSEHQPTIIAETEDWLVIDKPTGLLVHADQTSTEPTLVDWLIEKYPFIVKVGEDPVRPGIVHRLDREVSGLMVIAKTQAAYEELGKQFRGRTTKKTYLALVHGVIEKDEGDIKFRIARSTTAARMAARPVNEDEGKAAWTHFHVLERFRGATFVRLEILSGRTHQIRAHLHALGRPVMGDAIYTLKKTDRNVTAPRVMLQSVGLEFDDPTTKERRAFALEADPAFTKLLQEFRVS